GVATGAVRTVTVSFTVPADYAGPSITATASLTSASDPNSTNDSATVTTTVSATADVGIGKTGTATVIPGNAVVYTLIVTNAGPSDEQGVVVDDHTPPGLTFTSNAGHCVTASPCALGRVPAGATRRITVTFSVPAGYTTPAPIVNTATVATTTSDPVPANNSATAPTLVQVDADVEVTQSAPSNVLAGQTITITVSAIDHGPRDATGVAITDLLPAGFTFVSATASQGSYN